MCAQYKGSHSKYLHPASMVNIALKRHIFEWFLMGSNFYKINRSGPCTMLFNGSHDDLLVRVLKDNILLDWFIFYEDWI